MNCTLRGISLSLVILTISGCLSSVSYNLNSFNNGISFPVKVEDNRKKIQQKTLKVGPTLVIGDKYLIPTPVDIISKKLSDYLNFSAIEEIRSISLDEFKLIIYAPQHNAIGAGAAMAGVSYSLGILVSESKLAGISQGDGVIAKISIAFNGESFSCESYTSAYSEVGSLWGARVSGEELQKPFNDVISSCVVQLVEKTKFANL